MDLLRSDLKKFLDTPTSWEDEWTPDFQHRCYALSREIISRLENAKKLDLFFLTVNFKPDTPLPSVLEACDRISRRSFVNRYWYSIEQRGDTPQTMGTGLHTHFLFYTAHPLAQTRRDIYNSVKHLVGNPMHVDIRRYPVEMFQDKLSYLKGEKWDPEKKSKTDFDKLFRSENFLDPIYTNAQL